jgi:hypothetical protein
VPVLALPDAIGGFAAGPPVTGEGFVRRTYVRASTRVEVTMARLDLGPEGYRRWLGQSRAGYPQADFEVPASVANGFYQCAEGAMARCDLLVQTSSGVHLEIRAGDGASRDDVDAVASGLPVLRSLDARDR